MNESWVRDHVGWVEMDPRGPVVAGSWGTWRIIFHVGRYGIDDGGTVRLCHRFASDWSRPQTENPAADSYLSVVTDGGALLRIRYDLKGHVRPWQRSVVVDVFDGFLREGETLSFTLGDRSGGSRGSRAQTFCESAFRFRTFVDCFGSGEFVEAAGGVSFPIVAAEPAELLVSAPTEVVAGEASWLFLRVLDCWGNPSPWEGEVTLQADGPCEGLPKKVRLSRADGGVQRVEGIRWQVPGLFRVRADGAGPLRGESNPVLCHAAPPPWVPYWGDLHGQSAETIGTGTVEEYFHFAREKAGIDFCCHQGNDFQITEALWEDIRRTVHGYYTRGRFVTFVGYEWSAVTGAGGDRNVLFPDDEGMLHRTSHWQVPDKHDAATDRYPLDALFHTYEGRDVIIVPHIGGRRASLAWHHPGLEPVLEIHSAWGTFEWFYDEALERGYRLGIVAGSDDHKGRPGASYPGAGLFGVRGGLTCMYASALTREALWEALKRRRVYGTTGARIILHLTAGEHWMGEEFETTEPPTFQVYVAGAAGLEAVELKRGTQVIFAARPKDAAARTSGWVRVAWSGARIFDRGRQTIWDGGLNVQGGRILHAREYAMDSPDERILTRESQRITWRSTTTGDTDGVELEIEGGPETLLTFETAPKRVDVRLGDITEQPLIFPAGGIRQQVSFQRVSPTPGPRAVRFSFRDADWSPGWNAYFVRVLQEDGAMAWSSPIFIRRRETP
ncbi:MAG: DUF3604 domain-containing protein [Candidatus Methylomirabilales bacterium]